MSNNRRRGFAVSLAVGATLMTGAFAAAPAMAVAETHSARAVVQPLTVRHHVCAQDLYVRVQPAGQAIGTLYNQETFDVESYDASGVWAYGMAYGSVNAHGWVLAQYLC